MNKFVDTINDLERELCEICEECDEWSDMFDSVLKSYTDAEELLHSCKKEISMLLEGSMQAARNSDIGRGAFYSP